MSKAIIHAGMGKTGSSSIQIWLGNNIAMLSERFGLNVLRAYINTSDESGNSTCNLQPVETETHGDSNELIQIYHHLNKKEKEELFNSFFVQLRYYLDRGNNVIVSAEAFYTLLVNSNLDFITPLYRLAEDHDLCVAYYIRPQHEAMEAAWRQWGFRTHLEPYKYLVSYEKSLHYYNTYQKLKELAPNVFFQIRPYRDDLMDSGNVVTDFINNVLGLKGKVSFEDNLWINPSLPLEIVNLLRALPEKVLWTSPHDNNRLNDFKKIIKAPYGQESEETNRSRQIIGSYCYKKFEDSNKELIGSLGWNIDNFIIHPNDFSNIKNEDLKEINYLWKTKAGKSELILINQLIKYIFEVDKDFQNS